ncbi:assimilatory sulfite reductase (NADPH) flavoprotein subunit [Kangiella sediminilitoris]|uniref:Sulfite reductase [NADPH] flavoprotein alpha-component n=1 Tax=Kangiella sediminilitoris TaxID=1144748 RepID=A0A1B3BB82_9GAMM|nr:assimilatory sulfite reductase (NADPH) flavoprotein subunit [Kangiella sediminilitoris]AOE50049.1 Sulfite reductase [NADPH] flavoprotein alpha-component [Kangiella sediminilitoris]
MTAKEQKPNWLASKLIGDELVDKIKSLNPQELCWLSGYCAGLLENQAPDAYLSDSTTVSITTAEPIQPVLVLYASQTGNAQSIAESLFEALLQKGIDAVLKSTLDIKLKDLKNYSAILLTASTHGEGEPPDDAIELHEAIFSKKRAKLEGIRHAVLGLGDSSYEFFCQTAKDFNTALSDGGSSVLLEPVLCDVDYEEQAELWIAQVVSSIQEHVTANNNSTFTAVSDSGIQQESSVTSYDKNNPYLATVETIQRITGTGSPKETYHVEIDIEESGIQYQPGDSVGIIAHNKDSLVDEIIKILQFDPNETVLFRQQNFPLRTVLKEKAELTLINKGSLQSMLELAPSNELQDIIESGFSDFIEQHQFIDVVKIAKPNLTAQQLVDLLKPIKPRLYSISSSQEETAYEVHLTLNHVSVTNSFGTRYGLASHYLTQNLGEGDEVGIFIEKNPKFKLPESDAPIIMVGPGTGIAPFRAFLQHRETTENSGENWLFFGNPHFNTDFLYQVEIQNFLKSGVLTKVSLAFSRDSEEKVYVQHKLLEQGTEVWQWLESGAYFYVCGDMHRMAKDVEEALLQIAQEQGGLNEDGARQYLKQLKLDNRYQRDIY